MYPLLDSNQHARKRKILSLLCLPFHQVGNDINIKQKKKKAIANFNSKNSLYFLLLITNPPKFFP